MSTTTVLIVVLIAVLAVIAILAWNMYRKQRSRNLRNHFGPEYERTIQQYGTATKAERDLEARRKRMQQMHIRSLTPEEREKFAALWQNLQTRFVDDPAGTIRDADRVVTDVMSTRGYPMVDFEGRTEDLSVDHPYVVSNYRQAHEIALKEQSGTATTEELRRAVVCYRELFDELLERQSAPRR